jgi:hypothetical protein
MNEEDYLLEDDIPLATSLINEPEDEFLGGLDSSDDNPKIEAVNGVLPYEVDLSKGYDEIKSSGSLEEAAQVIISAMPFNNNSVTVGNILIDLFNKQGRQRIVTNSHLGSGLLRGSDVETEIEGDSSEEFNAEFEEKNRELVWRFIDYLGNRDLSQDNAVNRNRKIRQLPAFIIYLFSSGLYGLLINCPTLPEDYRKQVDNALIRLNESKYEIVEELAEKYDEAGRPEVATRVRQLQLAFFDKEPAELSNSAELRDLNLTGNDISIYKSVRSKFVNVSRSITQEVASELIEVVIDKESGISLKLKDKVRAEAILDVKSEFSKFAEESKEDIESANNILFNN